MGIVKIAEKGVHLIMLGVVIVQMWMTIPLNSLQLDYGASFMSD